MPRWWSPFAFVRWLLASERLEDAPDVQSTPTQAEEPHFGFWRWLLASEDLPELGPAPDEGRTTGLLRFIFSPERLPETPTTNSTGGNGA